MGLAIAKGIVEAHGGHIWIEKAGEGSGARVSFTVPVGDDELVRTADTPVQPAALEIYGE